MNISYACYVANVVNNTEIYPSWARAERYDFCESIISFFTKLKKKLFLYVVIHL